MSLTYKAHAMVEDLAVGECCIHSVSGSDGKPAYWHLWFYVAREDNGERRARRTEKRTRDLPRLPGRAAERQQGSIRASIGC
jgi:hypothetical protein